MGLGGKGKEEYSKTRNDRTEIKKSTFFLFNWLMLDAVEQQCGHRKTILGLCTLIPSSRK